MFDHIAFGAHSAERGKIGALLECEDLLVGLDVEHCFVKLDASAEIASHADDQRPDQTADVIEKSVKRRDRKHGDDAEDCEADAVAVKACAFLCIDFFFHFFHISFNELVQGDAEGLGQKQQRVDIGIGFVRFP